MDWGEMSNTEKVSELLKLYESDELSTMVIHCTNEWTDRLLGYIRECRNAGYPTGIDITIL